MLKKPCSLSYYKRAKVSSERRLNNAQEIHKHLRHPFHVSFIKENTISNHLCTTFYPQIQYAKTSPSTSTRKVKTSWDLTFKYVVSRSSASDKDAKLTSCPWNSIKITYKRSTNWSLSVNIAWVELFINHKRNLQSGIKYKATRLQHQVNM